MMLLFLKFISYLHAAKDLDIKKKMRFLVFMSIKQAAFLSLKYTSEGKIRKSITPIKLKIGAKQRIRRGS